MAKSKEPPELPLPPSVFGTGKGGDTVLPFGKLQKPIKGLMPDPSATEPHIYSYSLTNEELIELRSYLNSKPRLKQAEEFEHRARTPELAVGSGSPLDDSPLAMLKDLVHQIECGNINPGAAFVATVEDAPDGGEDYPFYVSRLTRLAVIGMLHELLEDLP